VLSVRAVLLDMDGTLVNSDAVVERVWQRWAARNGFDGDYVYSISHGRQSQDTLVELLPERPMEQHLAEARVLLEEETADLDGVVPVPGAVELMKALADVPHALVTSADLALATARMDACGLPMPATAITAEDVTVGKPAPEGFLKAAAVLGIEPADCVAFEDSAAGIAAAKAAGMRVIGVGERAAAHGPTLLVRDLRDVEVRTERTGADGLVIHIDIRARS
jgi:mannitol-1-/sugar-/sorbitol-6-phosphatase